MSTVKEQEELIERLKFTPRTYTLMLSGYGGEIVLGSVPREQYQYFVDNEIDLEQFAWDEDYELEVPHNMRPFEPGSWHECDDIAHENGCELSDSNYITVTDENNNQHWQSNLGYSALADAGLNSTSQMSTCVLTGKTESTLWASLDKALRKAVSLKANWNSLHLLILLN